MATTAFEAGLVRDPGLLDRLLKERRLNGIDRYDEVWEGIVHMVPAPLAEHNRFLKQLVIVLDPLARRLGGELLIGPNVRAPGSEPKDFRIPDLVYLSPADKSLLKEGWIDGGPSVVFEIRSPGDETYGKLSFYAALGVPEVVVLDRDTKRPQVFDLVGDRYVEVAPDPQGRVPIRALKVRLAVRDVGGEPVLFVFDDAAPDVPLKVY